LGANSGDRYLSVLKMSARGIQPRSPCSLRTRQYVARDGQSAAFDALMDRLKPVRAGRHFNRNKMSER
jgi:hypothetical protein